ncbi:cation-translocating P-type ATPase [Marinobacter sp. C2H3]|uniref:cation-translocating P-type ATPase n=1 Tax=Marinobacter sp. C2H3 TaxID=3119003 RepID=UPI00300F102B
MRPRPESPALPAAYRLPADDVVAALATDARLGLTESEALARLERDGPNRLASTEPPPLLRGLIAQCTDPMILILLLAAVISAFAWWLEPDLPWPYEALAILGIVVINAAMGIVQQARAERAIAALRQMAAARARVTREGVVRELDAASVVVGDLLVLEEGDTVAADGRLLSSVALQTAEASLTGESLPEAKEPETIAGDAALGDRQNMVFGGTSVTYGRGLAVVTATGMATEMGRIAGLLADAPPDTTPLQTDLARLGRTLGLGVSGLALVLVATLLALSDGRGLSAALDALVLGVALAVAAVPEGLPAVVTTVLALGVQRMARRKAIVRHLAAVETLGCANVIASDKTGTLTLNEMTVRTVVTASGRVDLRDDGTASGTLADLLRLELEQALTVGDRANNATATRDNDGWQIVGDPTEAALIIAARAAGLTDARNDGSADRVGEVPFSSDRKLMSTVHRRADDSNFVDVFTKGAPDVLLGRCTRERIGHGTRPLTPGRRAELLALNDALAAEALRSLGVASRALPASVLEANGAGDHLESELVFIGLIGLMDPPRPEARDAVAQARAAGIRPLMITGDHPVTAAVIGQQLGIGDGHSAVTGAELDRMPDATLRARLADVSVFARVNPEHKLRIVRALQANGDIVAMTGDGVNDAPALRAADIGIAMGKKGTDVAREAADMVLADDHFATIVAAVEEGRVLFNNIRTFLRYLLATNTGEVLTMFGGLLLAGPLGLAANGDGMALPLLATQILWINLVTDGAPALALGLDPGIGIGDALTRPPRSRREGVMTGVLWLEVLWLGAVTAVGSLWVLDASLPGGWVTGDWFSGAAGQDPQAYTRTLVFTTLVCFSLCTVFVARAGHHSLTRGLGRNRWLWGAVALSLGLQLAVVYVPPLQRAFSTVPLAPSDWLVCAGVASSVLWLREGGWWLHRGLRWRQLRSPATGPGAAGGV